MQLRARPGMSCVAAVTLPLPSAPSAASHVNSLHKAPPPAAQQHTQAHLQRCDQTHTNTHSAATAAAQPSTTHTLSLPLCPAEHHTCSARAHHAWGTGGQSTDTRCHTSCAREALCTLAQWRRRCRAHTARHSAAARPTAAQAGRGRWHEHQLKPCPAATRLRQRV